MTTSTKISGRANNLFLSLNISGTIICLLLLSACTFHNPAPVVDHSGGRAGTSQDPAGTYRVRPGDTLFGIAFSYGLDQRELASWNNIVEPYTIYPEQLLRLTVPSQPTADAGEVKIYKAATPQATTTRTYTTRDVPVAGATQKPVPPAPSSPASATPAGSTSSGSTPAGTAQAPVAQSQAANTQKPVPAATTPDKPAVASTAKPAAEPSPPPAPKPAATQSHADPISWAWPTSGRVLRGFVAGDPARNGVDIAGNEGQAIQATAAGTVVYSGNGLIGYGELIIIKHSDNMLSAYAHNKVRLAKEGQQVAAGEKIAEMGRNDRNEQLLHFEIRTRGKPVNPLTYLPRQ